jgi:hypothetical protein
MNAVSGNLLAQNYEVIELDSCSNLSNTCLTERATRSRKVRKGDQRQFMLGPTGMKRYKKKYNGTKR